MRLLVMIADDDGVYCPQCKDVHPTLKWHEKYDDYEMRETMRAEWEAAVAKRPNLLGGTLFEDFYRWNSRGLVEHEESSPCAVCGCATHFSDPDSGFCVCGDECRYEVCPPSNS